MKAILLTYDRRRPIAEHMLKTYSVHWPSNRFDFLLPFQEDTNLNSHGQNVQLVRTGAGIRECVLTLLDDLPDEEWIYWCIDDKYLIDLDESGANYFSQWVANVEDPHFAGLCFCRARRLLESSTVSAFPEATTGRGHPLLRRLNFNQIWLHQFLRVRALRALFQSFPAVNFVAKAMDTFKDALRPADDAKLFVTQDNHAVFGESSIGGKITTGCLSSMQRLGLEAPQHVETIEVDISIGKL